MDRRQLLESDCNVNLHPESTDWRLKMACKSESKEESFNESFVQKSFV